MILLEMSREDCAALVSRTRIGRLACAMNDQPYVVPVHLAYADGCLFSFSMPGQKIEWMRANPKVCVQFDEFTGSRSWRSVVISGIYEELPDRVGRKHERERAWSHLQSHANWWEPGGLKPATDAAGEASHAVFYRIRIEQMSGRQAVEARPDHA